METNQNGLGLKTEPALLFLRRLVHKVNGSFEKGATRPNEAKPWCAGL